MIKSHLEEKWEWPWTMGSFPKFGDSPLIFLHWLKLATSKLVCGWRFQRPIIKSHPEEKVGVSWARRASQNLGGFL